MNFIREDLLIKVKDINTIPNEEGLYVLNTELDMIKLGTSIDLRNRIKQYKIKDNICYITCSGSKYRENAMFEFMKNKLDITPFCKREYFKYSRTSLDKIISLFGSCEDNYIMNGFNEEQVEELKKYILDSNEEHEKDICKKCLEYKVIINDLKMKLKNATKNNSISKFINISLDEDTVRNYFIENITDNVIYKGVRGVCELFINNLCKHDGLIPVNNSKFKYHNDTGKIIYILNSTLVELIKEAFRTTVNKKYLMVIYSIDDDSNICTLRNRIMEIMKADKKQIVLELKTIINKNVTFLADKTNE